MLPLPIGDQVDRKVRRRTAIGSAGVVLIVLIVVVATRLAGPDGGSDPGAPSSAPASAAVESPEGPQPDTTGWVDANGEPVAGAVIEEFPGPEHCGWESTTWLRLRGALYIRDPRGLLRASTVVGFDPDVTLPPDAHSTGFHRDGRTIWVIGDPAVIYFVTATRVEQWPRALDPTMGCS